MRKRKRKICGLSYAQRVEEINRIYDEHCHSGLSNREILRRYIWPKYHICERTFYNMVNALSNVKVGKQIEALQTEIQFD